MEHDKNIGINKKLHMRVKLKATKEEKTIKDFVSEAIETKLEVED